MSYARGDKLRIRSLAEIVEIGKTPINSMSGLPNYADSDMAELFTGDHTVEFSQIDIGDLPNVWIRVSDPANPWNDWWFLEDDLEKIAESTIPVYPCGTKVILDECDNVRCSGQVGEVVRVLDEQRHSQIRVLKRDGEYRTTVTVRNERIAGLWYEGYVPPEIHYDVCCTRCSNIFSVTEGDEPDEEDQGLCPSCRQRRFITPYHTYQPRLIFYSTSVDDDLFLGVELEVDDGGESNVNAARVVDIMNEGGPFIYCSHDGSLTNGFEIITMPATNAYHHSIRHTYDEMVAQLKEMGYHSHNTSTCGIHVHFNRSFFGDDEEESVSKLLYLVEKFWDEIVVFSRRDYRSLDRYAKKMDIPADEFVDEWDKSGNHDGHYYAVNITNRDTIELRMFRGTLNMDSYMAILDFVDRLARAAKDKTVNEIQMLPFEALLTDAASKYYKARCEASKWED